MTKFSPSQFQSNKGCDQFRWASLPWALCIGLALLAGCGGGGGEGSADAPATGTYTPESKLPLVITDMNHKSAIQVPTIYAEALQSLAYDTMRWAERFAVAPKPTLTWPCGTSGSVAVTWVDVNGDAHLNSGDTLKLELTDCEAPASATRFSGSVQLSMTPPLEPGALAARVGLPAGLRFGAGEVSFVWKGAFDAERLVGERSDDLWVHSTAAEQLRLELTGPGVQAVDRIEGMDLTRTVSLDWHGTASSFDMNLASDVLRGKVVLSTPVSIFAYFDTFPMQGVLAVAGNGRTELRSGSGQKTGWLAVTEGAATGIGSTAYWSDFLQGLTWVGPGPLPQQYAAVQEVAAVPFAYVGSATADIDPTERKAEWQFNRGLRNSPAISTARLNRIGDGWGPASISATVETIGAHLRVRWSEQLEAGASYTVEWQDANGQRASPYAFARPGMFGDEIASVNATAQITVTNLVTAAIRGPASELLLPGTALHLDGSLSVASGSTLTRYRWSQLDGMPVQLSSTDQPAVDVSVQASTGTAPGDVTLQLEVSDARGIVDRQSVRLRAVPSPSTSVLAMLRGSPGNPLLDGRTVVGAQALWTAARLDTYGSAPFVRVFLPMGDPIGGGPAFFFLPAGTTLQPGTYLAPVSAFSRGDGAGILLYTSTATCDGSGSFTIHEAQLGAPDGSVDGVPIAQLAVDFTIACAGAPPITGAIRIASARPLPP
jgi:hypothetical protein